VDRLFYPGLRATSDSGEGPTSTRARLKALVVDDDASIRKIVAKVLIRDGFDVVGEAADGAQALEIAARMRPDVITMDVSMPGMDGLAALPDLRRILPGTLIVMLTMSMQYEEPARRGGADAYILKTRAMDELIAAIRSACEGAGALPARVEQARRNYVALLYRSGEAIELLVDLQAETPTPDGTFAAAAALRFENAAQLAMHQYFNALTDLRRFRERPP